MDSKALIDMTSEEILEAFSQATEEAVKKTHSAGFPTTHADDMGIYELYPDGRKVYKNTPQIETH